ncbi:PREDICTED: mitogen-activated protein kinase homolog NTF3-like [Ipomoea nil]|uniref:mitogen-activated protein kinase homolog NTF3-like n=1 Tax=Ipomoea nil TaxID=35883 RepID=UPI000901601F|nr:PREDICTED: mitogen-activated protein kinase homolog NTF3-like [Ipomoea nil]
MMGTHVMQTSSGLVEDKEKCTFGRLKKGKNRRSPEIELPESGMATAAEPPNGIWAPGKHYYRMWQTVFEVDTKYIPIKPIGRGAYGIVCSRRSTAKNEEEEGGE